MIYSFVHPSSTWQHCKAASKIPINLYPVYFGEGECLLAMTGDEAVELAHLVLLSEGLVNFED